MWRVTILYYLLLAGSTHFSVHSPPIELLLCQQDAFQNALLLAKEKSYRTKPALSIWYSQWQNTLTSL